MSAYLYQRRHSAALWARAALDFHSRGRGVREG